MCNHPLFRCLFWLLRGAPLPRGPLVGHARLTATSTLLLSTPLARVLRTLSLRLLRISGGLVTAGSADGGAIITIRLRGDLGARNMSPYSQPECRHHPDSREHLFLPGRDFYPGPMAGGGYGTHHIQGAVRSVLQGVAVLHASNTLQLGPRRTRPGVGSWLTPSLDCTVLSLSPRTVVTVWCCQICMAKSTPKRKKKD